MVYSGNFLLDLAILLLPFAMAITVIAGWRREPGLARGMAIFDALYLLIPGGLMVAALHEPPPANPWVWSDVEVLYFIYVLWAVTPLMVLGWLLTGLMSWKLWA